jgi:hypothetical protein
MTIAWEDFTVKDQNEYSARLTGNPFLFYEMKTVAGLIMGGLSRKDIIKKVREENLFQYKTTKSITKRLNAVLLRLEVLDDPILNLLVNASSETGKLIDLYCILKTDRLFYEFMQEEFRTKYLLHQDRLERVDFVSFFAHKAEQSVIVAGWRDYTITKLIQVYVRILLDAGLINDEKKLIITTPVMEPILKQYLQINGEENYIQAMLGGL